MNNDSNDRLALDAAYHKPSEEAATAAITTAALACLVRDRLADFVVNVPFPIATARVQEIALQTAAAAMTYYLHGGRDDLSPVVPSTAATALLDGALACGPDAITALMNAIRPSQRASTREVLRALAVAANAARKTPLPAAVSPFASWVDFVVLNPSF